MPRNDALTLPQPASLYRGPLSGAWGVVRTGRLRRAATALGAFDVSGWDADTRADHAALVVTTRLGLGDLSGATAAGRPLKPLLTSVSGRSTLALLAHGDLAAAFGDHATARDHFLLAASSPHAEDPDLAPWRAGAAVALLRTGDRAEAVRIARELVTRAEQAAHPHPIALALRTLAITDARVDPIRTLRRAQGLALHSDDLRLLAQIKTDLASQLLLAAYSERSEAIAILREAETMAATQGLWPLHARVSRLLDMAGERPRPLGGESLAVLTNAERRVADLASQGLTNRQIAEQLTVTVKGVEWHLSRVYRKLGIGTRTGLGALLDSTPNSASA